MQKSTLAFLGVFFTGCFISFGDALDNWTKVSTSPYTNYNQIIYANGAFVATANPQTFGRGSFPYNYTNGLSFSSDGMHWTHTAIYDASSGLAFGNGKFGRSAWEPFSDGDEGFVYGAANPANLLTNSYPPYNPNVPENGQYGLTFGSNIFVAVGYYYEGAASTIYTSADLQNWTSQSASTSGIFLSGLVYGNGRFVAVGYPYVALPTNASVLRSSNGTNWTAASSGALASIPPLANVSFVNGTYYATPLTNGNPTNAYASTTGVSWTAIIPPYPSLFVPGTFSNGLYISVHPGYPLATSVDGTNWTVRSTGITNTPTCIAYGNNCFVMCCADGSIFRSGSTVPSLSPQSRFTNGGFQLTVTDGIGPAYQIQGSTNLVKWTNIAMVTNIEASNTFLDLAASNYSPHFYRLQAQ